MDRITTIRALLDVLPVEDMSWPVYFDEAFRLGLISNSERTVFNSIPTSSLNTVKKVHSDFRQAGKSEALVVAFIGKKD